MQTRPIRSLLAFVSLIALGCAAGCQTPQQYLDSLKGEGFPGWNSEMGGGVRGADPNAKPSGYFFNRKSEQIEQSLGGSF